MIDRVAPTEPYGLPQWLAFLKDKPLPAQARVLARLQDRFRDPNLSLQELPPIIRLDPALCLHLVSLANRLNSNPDTDVSSIELAVSTLGLDRIQSLVASVPAIRMNHASVAHKQYFHAIDNSYLAATLVKSLCRSNNPALSNDSYMAALFYGVGHWALWRYAPYRISDVRARILEQQVDVVLAENDVLGCTIQQISEALAQEWQLSRLAVLALKHSTSPDAEMLERLHRRAQGDRNFSDEEHRQLKYLLNAPFLPVKLANWLALSAPLGWQTAKVQRLIEIIADYLRQPPDDVTALIHRQCAQASREYRVPGVMPPAAELILLPSSLRLPYRLRPPQQTAQPTPRPAADSSCGARADTQRPETPAPGAARETSYRDRETFMTSARLLSEGVSRPPGEVLETLLKGLFQGLGLARVGLYLIDGEQALRSARHYGFEPRDPLTRYTQNLKIPSLFKRISAQPQGVWIGPHNREAMWPQLPERFKAACHPETFLLLSLFRAGKPMALIYADHLGADQPLAEFHFKQFRSLGRVANQCLNLGAPRST